MKITQPWEVVFTCCIIFSCSLALLRVCELELNWTLFPDGWAKLLSAFAVLEIQHD